ncbi:hypothetical protein [Lysinibacter cavernae]|uniref:Heme/copper-type cytochrome/quinol oxidase subunit 2 n=1 Tax=Lysinibacter cavernae TaxID=1640652 RepID=A0A7X5QZ90_9MICO|nr:hypothetical protein [Lysinibacter cavernae]NIH52739.1 heme/copper-type cytochrome/quinol oxidase subunit 2 [Lysinibacter cavernae]
MSFLSLLAAEGAHEVTELAMPTFMFGGVALVVFAALGVVTWTYRDVANRHHDKAEAYAREHADSH